jgi:hypothetical protein
MAADSLRLRAAQYSFSESNTRAEWLKTAGRFYGNEFLIWEFLDISGGCVGEGGMFRQEEGAMEACEKSEKH